MSKLYDFAVFIGRFQPFHNGHADVINAAMQVAEHTIVLVGSSNLARTTRNPFTYEERKVMINDWASLAPDAPENDWPYNNLHIHDLPDVGYDDNGWVEHVQRIVAHITAGHVKPRICLIGHERDNSSYYLRLFPQWTFIPLPGSEIEATTVRNSLFTTGFTDDLESLTQICPKTTMSTLRRFRMTPEFDRLLEESEFFKRYRQQWGEGPFNTVDAVVVKSGHVLLVERGDMPGKGMLALPGGFLEKGESLLQGAIRELAEETNLGQGGIGYGRYVSPDVLRASVRHRETFDDPHRSQRGRVITHAFLFDLGVGDLPVVKGADDAKDARWVPISELRVDGLFEDHGAIIRNMLRKL